MIYTAYIPQTALLFPPNASRCDFGRRHQIPNILLQKLIVIIKLIVLLLHSLDAVEDLEEGFLQNLRMPVVMSVMVVECGMATAAQQIQDSLI